MSDAGRHTFFVLLSNHKKAQDSRRTFGWFCDFCGLKMSDARRHTHCVLLSLALVLFAFTPIRRLATLSLNLVNNHLSYIPLVPFLSAALTYWNRKRYF